MKAWTLPLAVSALLLVATPADAKWRAHVPLPPQWPTVYHHTACPGNPDAGGCAARMGVIGCSNPAGCIWLNEDADRYDRMHELGHIFDAQVLTDRDRRRFTRLLGLGQRPWQKTYMTPGGVVTDDFDSPNEWFADAYAHCALRLDGRLHHGVGRSVVAYFEPGPRLYDRLCAAIRFVAAG